MLIVPTVQVSLTGQRQLVSGEAASQAVRCGLQAWIMETRTSPSPVPNSVLVWCVCVGEGGLLFVCLFPLVYLFLAVLHGLWDISSPTRA